MIVGGRTARATLERLGVVQLTVAGTVHHGAVILHADDGGRLITRPGSFGAPDSLFRCAQRTSPPSDVKRWSSAMRSGWGQAADILDTGVEITTVESALEANSRPGRINVVDLDSRRWRLTIWQGRR